MMEEDYFHASMKWPSMKLSLPDPLFVDFLILLPLFLLIDSYSVARQPLGPSRLTHDKMNICHQLIVEHHWISEGKEKQKNKISMSV